ncbi:CCA tRNA nucleotidyltransferase [Fictibacillus barbaricus]|uniref:CCA-adding enzyme n=1 Tax=Fictibacillus barbaricus TaxID=182136 RepID=A0ABU1TZ98_9BACL|nr:CCA tRNA nucleotidyltransferase [Fictibacillus barbaricus]MDR7072517.1 tRNA nucleotidyltransferase (CCA-adding enzyme) [Fictibacillus barbaricus]
MNELFKEASYVLNRIEENGYRAYFVGGCVRDHWMDKPIKDIDIASSAKPEEIQRIFPKTIPVGIEHGTVIVRHNHVSYEVTTFRKEGKYEDFRRPSKVWFVTDLEEDLSRRDFTFNAMAMDKSYKLYDPFNGREDLAKKQIRTVGQPDERFCEDPLRLMRACRFISTYHLTIEEKTKKAIENNASLIKRISVERITDEFRKLLEGEWAGPALNFMKTAGIVKYLPYPIEEKREGNLLAFNWNFLQTAEQKWSAILILSKVKDYREFLKKWKLPNAVMNQILKIMDAYQIKHWTKMDVYRFGLDTATLAMELKYADQCDSFEQSVQRLKELALDIPITSRNEIPIDGEDILRIKKEKPGVWIGLLYDEMEKEIVEGKLPLSQGELVDWVRRWEQK